MKERSTFRLFLALAFTTLVIWACGRVRAQSGNVVFIGATSGTTLSANCPATPTTPSLCVVGGGVYVWQSSTTGWFLPQPASAVSGTLTGITICNAAGASCVPATVTNGVVALDIPSKVTVTVPAQSATVTVQ